MLKRIVFCITLFVLVVACSKSSADQPVQVVAPTPTPGLPGEVVRDMPVQVAREVPRVTTTYTGASSPNFGEKSLDDRIFEAAVVARVTLRSVTSGVTTFYANEKDTTETTYVGHIDFNFNVVEYLKGSGSNQIVGVVMVYPQDFPFIDNRTEIDAELADALRVRDTRWDNREAVVFMEDSYREGTHVWLPYVRQAGRYYLGDFAINGLHDSGYTVWSEWSKNWLPAADADSGEGGSDDEAEFLTSSSPPAPPRSTLSRGTTASDPTITLSDLKAEIADMVSWLAENGGGADQRQCIAQSLLVERFITTASPGHDPMEKGQIQTAPIQSGQAAGTIAWSDFGGTTLGSHRERFTVAGGDSSLFTVELGPNVPVDRDGDGTNEGMGFERRMLLVRPLPAGTFSFQVLDLPAARVQCDGYVYTYDSGITVTAHAGVVAESFFDPADSGTSVSGTTTLGPISWENGQVTATLNRDITGHALDFIGLDGSVEVLLKAADATRSGSTWTWPVASQPWEDGDKLMVRLYGVTTTTCTGESVPFAACVLTFSPAAYAFTVLEDASVGHAVSVVSAISPTAGATVMYSLTAGNADGKFALDTTTGQITVAAALDSATASSYTLTVEASDGSGETATATVAVTVAS